MKMGLTKVKLIPVKILHNLVFICQDNIYISKANQ